MPITEESFIRQFSRLCLDERTSLFLGAGASCDAGYPAWSELYRPLAEELGLELGDDTDYFRLGQYYANRFGAAELRRRINEYINRATYESELMDALLGIGFSDVWTTNFDNVVELNYIKRGVSPNVIYRDCDLGGVTLSERTNVFKLNGDIRGIGSIVATQEDLEGYERGREMLLTFFRRELVSSTFLFVGYSFSDHLALDNLSRVSSCMGGSLGCHYAIMKNAPGDSQFDYFVQDLERRYSLRVLLVDGYEDVPRVLRKLAASIRSRRVFVSGALSYDVPPEVEATSHHIARGLACGLLDADYRIVSGIGRHFGNHLLGYAHEHLARKGVSHPERHVLIKTFAGYGPSASESHRATRKQALGECGSAVFAFGRIAQPPDTSGTLEEFEVAKELGLAVVPIRCQGMVSGLAWDEVRSNISRYPYLEKAIDLLDVARPPEDIARAVVSVLDDVNRR